MPDRLYSIESVSLKITPDDEKVGFKYPASNNESDTSVEVIQISTGFTLQSIPTCSCVLACGGFINAGEATTHIDDLINKFSQTRHRIEISCTWQMCDDIYNPGTSKSITTPIFNGIIVNVNANDVRNTAKSSRFLSLTAIHVFAELMHFGTGGLIYASPDDLQQENLLTNLLINTNKATTNSNDPTFGPQVIGTTLQQCVPQGGTASPVSTLIKTLVGVLLKDRKTKKVDQVFPGYDNDTAYHVICNRLSGSAASNLPPKLTETLYRKFANHIWKGMAQSNLADAILKMIATPDSGLVLAPRSTEYISICSAAPDESKCPNGNSGITAQDVLSSNRTDSRHTTQNPDGVIIIKSGSHTVATGGKTGGVVTVYYPDKMDNPGVKRLYAHFRAPGWIQDLSRYKSTSSSKSGQRDDMAEKTDEALKTYAKHMYDMIKYRNSGINIKMGVYAADSYQYLGMIFQIPRCDVDNPSVDPDSNKIYIGKLTSYNFSMSISANGSSNVVVSLTFTQVQTSRIYGEPDGDTTDIDDAQQVPSGSYADLPNGGRGTAGWDAEEPAPDETPTGGAELGFAGSASDDPVTLYVETDKDTGVTFGSLMGADQSLNDQSKLDDAPSLLSDPGAPATESDNTPKPGQSMSNEEAERVIDAFKQSVSDRITGGSPVPDPAKTVQDTVNKWEVEQATEEGFKQIRESLRIPGINYTGF